MNHPICYCILLLFALTLGGCEPGPQVETGGIAVRLVWPSPAELQARRAGGYEPRSGLPSSAKTVRVRIDAPDMITIQKDFAASAHRGRIEGVPAGRDRTLTVQALDSQGEILANCEKGGLLIEAGKTTQAGDCVFSIAGLAGTLKWRKKYGEGIGIPVVTEYGGIIFPVEKAIVSLGPGGQERWRYDTEEEVVSVMADPEGNLYMVSASSKVISLTGAGQLRWTWSDKDYTGLWPILGFSDDKKIHASFGDFEMIFDGGSGERVIGGQLSLYSTGAMSYGSTRGGDSAFFTPVVSLAGLVLKGGVEKGAEDETRALLATQEDVSESAEYHYRRTTRYIGNEEILPLLLFPAVGRGDVLYTFALLKKDDSDLMIALSTSGEVLWNTPCAAGMAVVGKSDVIYFGCDDGYFYAVNSDGSTKWRTSIEGVVGSYPAIASDGTIYFGSTDKHLYALNETGQVVWKYQTEGEVDSAISIGHDGTVYFSDSAGYIYAVRGSAPLDTAAPWPKFQSDEGNTGRQTIN